MATLTLLNFEKKTPNNILDRGKKILKNDMILDLKEIFPGEWTATVQSSKRGSYLVTVSLDGNTILDSYCDCPDDYNNVCKHQAGVLFQLREQGVGQMPAEIKAAEPKARLTRADILAQARKTRLERYGVGNIKQAHDQPGESAPAPIQTASVQELFDQFDRLDKTEARLVKIAAVAWELVSQTKFLDIFNGSAFKHNGINLYVGELKSMLPKLSSAGFLLQIDAQYRCNSAFADALCDRDFSGDPDFRAIAKAIDREIPLSWYTHGSGPDRLLREMRLAKYLDRPDQFNTHYFNLISKGTKEYTQQKLLDLWLPATFDLAKLEMLPLGIRAFLLAEKFIIQTLHLLPTDAYFLYAVEKLPVFEESARGNLARLTGQIYLLQGDWNGVRLVAKHAGLLTNLIFDGIHRLIIGNTAESITAFQFAVKELRRESRSPKNTLTNLGGLFEIMAQLKTQDTAYYQKINVHLEHVYKHGTSYLNAFQYIQAVLLFLQNNKEGAIRILNSSHVTTFPITLFFKYLCQYWVEEKSIDRPAVEKYHEMLSANGYGWLAAEMLALRAGLNSDDTHLRSASELESARLSFEPLTGVLPRIETWEQALNLLSGMVAKSAAAAEKENDTRLIWLVDFDRKVLQPKEQRFGKKGWTSGRAVPEYSLTRNKVTNMTVQDIRIAEALGYHSWYYLQAVTAVWQALVGHPLLFLAKSPEIAVQLTEESPVLVAQKTDKGFQLKFSHKFVDEGFLIIKETPTRYKLITITPEHTRVIKAFGGAALFVPNQAAERLDAILSGLARQIPVQSAFESANLPVVPADARVCVHLLPVGDGFHVELYAKPFTTTPPYFKPGAGDDSVTAFVGGEQVRSIRDLKAETKNRAKFLEEIPMLRDVKPHDDVWELENADQCLELLAQLYPLVESASILLEWPKGEKLRITALAGFDQFKMRIRGQNNWFEVEGELRVDENRVLTMQELLAMSTSGKQFMEISPGKIIALTAEFRRRLRQIDGLMTTRKNGALQLHPLAASALDSFTELVQQADFDQKFLEKKEKIRAAFEVKYKLPKKFNAELRPYQLEGFEWLSRCAAAELGACLADDMGLGKTVQALALLTARASLGPALVVAPASVCRNWVAETQKFSPALRPILFSEGDRATGLKKAGKGDLLIVTYDLLARSSDQFEAKQFATILLDEAQSIKNRGTKRSETAMKLNGDFRLIMTGTPLENHLGELWNLFQFINPGLLGSIEDFNERFAIPIEKYGDEARRDQLRRLVQPFMLRRRKDEVLRELPAKTEITLSVPLSPEERVFYEALRRNALAALTGDNDKGGGEKHLQILAEIMRLRRAACHPKLADATAGFKTSAKLELFAEIVDELIENGHKALVFSQFVGHLEILQEYLKKKNITYQYLDGQTPQAKRQKNIEAFQAGKGDLFLISLKAGGTGLNLTAADYVIHMDPWWNPAVEDQATDRAHRIGQVKPVTVYRIIAEQTIEEKILQLHVRKRDLADSLLAGTDMSAKLTAADLMRLIEEG